MCEGLFWGLENMFRVFLNIAVVPGHSLAPPGVVGIAVHMPALLGAFKECNDNHAFPSNSQGTSQMYF